MRTHLFGGEQKDISTPLGEEKCANFIYVVDINNQDKYDYIM